MTSSLPRCRFRLSAILFKAIVRSPMRGFLGRPAGRRHCRNVARIRQPQRGCIDGYQFTAKQFSDPRSLARSGVPHVEKLGKLTSVKAELDASVVVNTGGASD